MTDLLRAHNLGKSYGAKRALDGVNLRLEPGRIYGLIGPNGAGKSTLLKSILGLLRYDGDLTVTGLDPHRDRARMLQKVSFIADVASLPRWIRVSQLVDYMASVHPAFSRDAFMRFFERTEINPGQKVATLSKGMTTQLHLALVMAIDAQLLILDEPTLGLDILYRKQFYSSLVTEFFSEERAIIVSTHQVEEIEHILTDLIFIKRGKLILQESMSNLPERFVQLRTSAGNLDAARGHAPIFEQQLFGQHILIYDGCQRQALEPLGELGTPGVADLFVAMMGGEK
jgi:ABC-2 type transport system ATP-binding protein